MFYLSSYFKIQSHKKSVFVCYCCYLQESQNSYFPTQMMFQSGEW